ncbi:hypothetical protein GCM10009765_61820 [Fodinicola feengrottensis]|uniref:Secreted protein n=2 Tax=Fodinicola feengrottensis TaxID=435914 RepID=A0ABN2IFT8_9ACTN
MSLFRTTARAAVLLGAVGALVAPAASYAAPAAVSGYFTDDGVRIRSQPNPFDPNNVVGLGYRGHSVTVYCLFNADANGNFYQLRDNTTGVSGYSSIAYTHANGDVSYCPNGSG